MKNLVIAGLYEFKNYGDRFIMESVDYLARISNKNINSIFLDFEHNSKDYSFCDIICIDFALLLLKIPFISIGIKSRLQYLVLKCKRRKYFESLISKADLLIFGCGSFKYTTQYLWAYYCIITKIASKYNVPVMYNAMNIQKYNSKDWRCKMLKKYVNYDCVKIITSRDGDAGVDRFNEYYKTNLKLAVYPTADPAVWIDKVHQQFQNINADTIGINLIRPDIFKLYGKNISEQEVIDMYFNLIKSLDKNNIKWKLFTNGLEGDVNRNVPLLNKLNIKSEDVIVPKSSEDAVRVIGNFKCVLGARMHVCIASYSLGIPFVTFVWDDKLHDFANLLNWTKFAVESDIFCKTSFYDKLMNSINEKYDVKHQQYLREQAIKYIKDFVLQ